MSHVRDMSLAESGRMKIRWVQDFMPALVAIRARFEREKPFAGKKITISIHMEAKTAFLALCLAAGGAEVHATGCNPLSTQDDVAAGLASMGVETYAMHGVNAAEYRGLLVEALVLPGPPHRRRRRPAGPAERGLCASGQKPARRRGGDDDRHPPPARPRPRRGAALPDDERQRCEVQALL